MHESMSGKERKKDEDRKKKKQMHGFTHEVDSCVKNMRHWFPKGLSFNSVTCLWEAAS